MLSYVIQRSHLIAADERYADKILLTDRGSNHLTAANESYDD